MRGCRSPRAVARFISNVPAAPAGLHDRCHAVLLAAGSPYCWWLNDFGSWRIAEVAQNAAYAAFRGEADQSAFMSSRPSPAFVADAIAMMISIVENLRQGNQERANAMMSKEEFVAALRRGGMTGTGDEPDFDSFDQAAAIAHVVSNTLPAIGFASNSGRLDCFLLPAANWTTS